MAAYFVQHGRALSKEQDPNRSLSPEGIREVERMARFLQKAGLTVREVCHSGKTRAEETAHLFADKFAGCRIRQLSGMNPNDDVIAFAKSLDMAQTMYVGHLPHLSRLLSYLVAEDESREVARFTNGGVICLEKDNAGFYIDWYLKPSLCID